MFLFDHEIEEFLSLIEQAEAKELPVTDALRKDAGKNNMVFANESAYELGGGNELSLSVDLPTSNSTFIDHDGICLFGKDLSEIEGDTPFARITLTAISDDDLKGDELYDRLEKIRFTKYRVSPEGYMLRTAIGDKEKVRVSKDCAAGSNFSQIGSAYIKAYRQLPFVKNVMIFFFTGESPLYEELQKISEKKKGITDAVDHILKGMVINDCNACSVKELCDQVEGMREIHQEQDQKN